MQNIFKKFFKRGVTERRSVGTEIFLWILFFIFLGYTVTLFYPLYWAIINSLKSPYEFFRNIYGLPKEWVWENFSIALEVSVGDVNIIGMFLNSVVITVTALFIAILECTMTGYIFSKYKFPGSKFIYNMMLLVMLIPLAGSTPALYKFYVQTGLFDTHIGVILLYCGGFGYPFLLMFNFFESVSWSYAEAAQIDGASDWGVFIQVMLPQAFGMMGAIALMSFMNIYGDYTNPFMYLPTHPTLSVGITQLSDSMQSQSRHPIAFAAMLISCIPTWIFYFVTNSKMYNLKIDTGIKG